MVEEVSCPSCGGKISFSRLNSHLDRCLQGASAASSSGAQASTEPNGVFGAMMGGRKRKAEVAEDEAGKALANKASNDQAALHHSRAASIGMPANSLTATDSGVADVLNAGSDDKSNLKAGPSQPTSLRDRLDEAAPLAERLRPRSLSEYVGQETIVKGPLAALLRQGKLPSIILWGPPGVGKTTLARLLAKTANDNLLAKAGPSAAASSSSRMPPYRFIEISATTAGTAEVKKIFDESLSRLQLTGQRTCLFIDEVHRFNRAQQDLLLPVVEKGQIVLVAATTENPSFRVQSAMLSRMRVFVLSKLSKENCMEVLRRARARALQLGYGQDITYHDEKAVANGSDPTKTTVSDTILDFIAASCDGDARAALQALEVAFATLSPALTDSENLDSLRQALKRQALYYDQAGDAHYDTISALHKSIRGSNADAALYYLARMVSAGDDPLFIARRLIVAASEDCSDYPLALQMAVATQQAVSVVGLPEAGENLAQLVVLLCEAPKSTRSYRAWKKALNCVQNQPSYPIPMQIRNAPTKLMKNLGYGKDYRYEPRFAHPVHQDFFPEEMLDEDGNRRERWTSPPPPTLGVDDTSPARASANGIPRSSSLTASSRVLPTASGVGPGACQRVFSLGARVVDFDLLDEWERKHNGGEAWSGRAALEERVSRDGKGVDVESVKKEEDIGT